MFKLFMCVMLLVAGTRAYANELGETEAFPSQQAFAQARSVVGWLVIKNTNQEAWDQLAPMLYDTVTSVFAVDTLDCIVEHLKELFVQFWASDLSGKLSLEVPVQGDSEIEGAAHQVDTSDTKEVSEQLTPEFIGTCDQWLMGCSIDKGDATDEAWAEVYRLFVRLEDQDMTPEVFGEFCDALCQLSAAENGLHGNVSISIGKDTPGGDDIC